MYTVSSAVQKKWKDVLDIDGLPSIQNRHTKAAIAQCFENVQTWNNNERAILGSYNFLTENAPTNAIGTSSSIAGTGNIDTFDPIMISLLRRSMPNLVAYDLVGVQAMKGPTGLIFAFRTQYATAANSTSSATFGPEAFYYEANTDASSILGANAAVTQGNSTVVTTGPGYQVQGNSSIGTYFQWWDNANSTGGFSATSPGGGQVGTANSSFSGNSTASAGVPGVSNNAGNTYYNYQSAMNTALAEQLGSSNTAIFPEMAFTIEKVTATAGSRALKAEYSMELAQDLKAIHGLDAETELSNILSTEILTEINREIVRAVNITAKPGSQVDVTTAGIFDLDVDSNGRWLVEKFAGMYYQIEREANQIAKDTRRGKGNVMICTADIASALNAAGKLGNTPRLDTNLQVDDTGNTFVGTLQSGMKVYIDPYAIGGQYWVVGFKGSNPMDAGLFYCPYVPLQMVRAVDPGTMQPKIGFKTRYAVVANPYAQGTTKGYGQLVQDSNVYYRRTVVTHLQ